MMVKKTLPRILVLLATYNGATSLREQINSILGQTGVDVNILVSDDASTDSTKEILLDYAGKESRLAILGVEGRAGSAGANFRRLFTNANLHSYDFVALSDQDDIWHVHKLGRAIEMLRLSGANGYSCAVEAFWPNGRKYVLPQSKSMTAADFLFEGAGQGCTFVLPVAQFAKVQAFCRNQVNCVSDLHFHDWLIYLLTRTWDGRWYFDEEVGLSYRQHMSNEIGSRGSIRAITHRLDKIRNGWYRKQIASALAIYSVAGGCGELIVRFQQIFQARQSVLRRFRLLFFFLQNGRRSFSDRAVLALSSVLGWI